MAKHQQFLSTSERPPEALLKRLRGLMDRAAVTGTPWAMMRLVGELTEAEHDACSWFNVLHDRYRRALDVRGLRGQAYEAGSRGAPPDPFSAPGERVSSAERRTVAEFRSAEMAGRAAGCAAWRDFCAVVIDEHEPENGTQRGAVALVARALARHRQLGSRHRQGRRKGA